MTLSLVQSTCADLITVPTGVDLWKFEILHSVLFGSCRLFSLLGHVVNVVVQHVTKLSSLLWNIPLRVVSTVEQVNLHRVFDDVGVYACILVDVRVPFEFRVLLAR